MDYTKFPFNRGVGPASLEAQRQARFLDTLGAPSLHRRNADGSMSSKVNGALFVDPGITDGIDGYYSMGTAADGKVHYVGSATARGVFSDRGQFGAGSEYASNDQKELQYFGNGFGTDVRVGDAGYSYDHNGRILFFSSIKSFKTRTGSTFSDVLDTFMSPAYPGGYFLDRWQAWVEWCPPVYVGGDARWLCANIACVQYLEGGYRFVVTTNTNGEGFSYADIETVPNQLPWLIAPSVTSPNHRVARCHYFRPGFDQAGLPSPINESAHQGIEYQFSDDAGATWERTLDQPAMQEWSDTVLTLSTGDTGAAGLFNLAVIYCEWAVVPVSANISIAMMLVPYVGASGAVQNVGAKVKIARIDHATRTITETLLLEDFDPFQAPIIVGGEVVDGGVVRAASYFFRYGVAIGGGALFMIRPSEGGLPVNDHPRFIFTKDGTNVQHMPLMPWPAKHVGVPSAIDQSAVVLPVYLPGSGYVLMQTTDLGATWARRAMLSASAPAPSGDYNYLLDFAVVTKLRDGNMPANATPGAPWISDVRYTAPE